MKRFRHIIVVITIALLAVNVNARTVEIKMSQCAKPYVDNLRSMTANLGPADELILNFDKAGKYEFDGSLKFRCNTTIKGLGPNATKVIVKEGYAGGKSKMKDDTFFAVHGSSTTKVRAEVRDICFELASHKGVLWEKAPKHIVKICYGNGVIIDNIVTKSQNATLTHVDLRNCENAVVGNSYFENYNNNTEGGCLWSRGAQRNIRIANNVFRKYGKDEVFGCWGGVNDKDFEVKDVVVENNEFFLDNKMGVSQLELVNFLAFCHDYGEGAKTYCNLEDIYFKNNKIKINAPIKRIMVLTFCKYSTVNNLEISNNEILCTAKSSVANLFMNDFDVIAESLENVNITIKDNYIRTQNEIQSSDGHTFLSARNASITLANNIIENEYPQRLIWCHGGSMRLKLNNNIVTNVYTTTLSSSKTIDNVWITAVDNSFSGDTRIYCRNVKNLDLVYKNNVFNSSDYHFFLQEGAEHTSLVFENNTVNSKAGKGKFYTNYGGKPCSFGNVTITGNTFNGVRKTDVIESITKARNTVINNNSYR